MGDLNLESAYTLLWDATLELINSFRFLDSALIPENRQRKTNTKKKNAHTKYKKNSLMHKSPWMFT